MSPSPAVSADQQATVAAVADRPLQMNQRRRAAVLENSPLWQSAAALWEEADQRRLPVDEPLASVLPAAGLRRGEVGEIRGATSLILATIAGPSRRGHWCAMAGFPSLGLAAAGEAGVDLDRLVLLPRPGPDWLMVVAALLEAFDVVVLNVHSEQYPTAQQARRLAALVRQRSSVLLVGATPTSPQFPGARWRLEVMGQQWEGAGAGDGHLQACSFELLLQAADIGIPRRCLVRWPAPRPSSSVLAEPVPVEQAG